MRPIDYAIKLIVAYNMKIDMFNDFAEPLYYMGSYSIAVRDFLYEHDIEVLRAVEKSILSVYGNLPW